MKKYFASHLIECKDVGRMDPRILSKRSICIEQEVDICEHCNDDDTYSTAKSMIPELVASKVDANLFSLIDKPLDIGVVTPITKTNPHGTTPRSPCMSSLHSTSGFRNIDLA